MFAHFQLFHIRKDSVHHPIVKPTIKHSPDSRIKFLTGGKGFVPRCAFFEHNLMSKKHQEPGDSSRDQTLSPNVGGHVYNLWVRVTWTHHPKKVTSRIARNGLFYIFYWLCLKNLWQASEVSHHVFVPPRNTRICLWWFFFLLCTMVNHHQTTSWENILGSLCDQASNAQIQEHHRFQSDFVWGQIFTPSNNLARFWKIGFRFKFWRACVFIFFEGCLDNPPDFFRSFTFSEFSSPKKINMSTPKSGTFAKGK